MNRFNHVSLHGIGDLKIDLEDEEFVLIKAEDNLLPHITTKVQGGRLIIQFVDGVDPDPTQPIELYVMAEELESRVSGTGSYEAADAQSARAEVSLAGTGTAVLRVSDHLEADMAGACLVKHMGDPEIDANIAGTGIIKRIGE